MKTELSPPRTIRALAAPVHAAALLAALAAATPAYAADSAAAPAATSTPPAAPAAIPQPALPLEFSKFATDFKPITITPPWLTVQIGTIETYYAPPLGKTSFWLEPRDFVDELAANFHPIELSCLMGAKARYDNVTYLDLDKTGHPLGYTLPLGQVVYFLARGTSDKGIMYSFNYYDSGKDLVWVPDPKNSDTFIPVTKAIVTTQDMEVPFDDYAFLYLSVRLGPPRPGSTAKPLPLYTYLVVRVHVVPPPAPPTGITGAGQ